MDTKEDPLESLMAHLGEFGKYQAFQFVLCLLGGFTSGLHMLALAATFGTPEHRCLVPSLENNTTLPWDSDAITSAIPTEEDGSLSSCFVFQPGTNISTACDAWVYNTTYYTYTRVTQWELICDKRWMLALAQSAYMFGVFVGAMTCGSIADKIGRKAVFCWSGLLQLIISIGIAFVSSYPLFLIIQFIYGIVGSAGAYTTAFCLIMELVGPSKRTIYGLLYNGGFSFGIITVAVWGYFITHATTLQLILGAHSLLIAFHWWLLDESPRWLWGQGRFSESVDIVAKGVKMNGGPEFDKAEYVSKGRARYATQEQQEAAGFLDLFKTPRLRSRTLNIGFCWFANSIAYYGLSLNANKMGGNPFINLFIMAAVELPTYALDILLLDRLGRRSLTSSLMLIGGAFCLCTAIIPPEMATASTIMVFFGKFCISASFPIVCNYSAEIFPTVVRNTGLGFGASCARLAAMLTPVVTLMDAIDKRLPIVVFAIVDLISGFFVLFLPETMDLPMPETIEDGETFGVGDTVFTTGCLPKKRKDYAPANTT